MFIVEYRVYIWNSRDEKRNWSWHMFADVNVRITKKIYLKKIKIYTYTNFYYINSHVKQTVTLQNGSFQNSLPIIHTKPPSHAYYGIIEPRTKHQNVLRAQTMSAKRTWDTTISSAPQPTYQHSFSPIKCTYARKPTRYESRWHVCHCAHLSACSCCSSTIFDRETRYKTVAHRAHVHAKAKKKHNPWTS